jgi:hypothetical protein
VSRKRAETLGYTLKATFNVKPNDAPKLASIFWEVDYDDWKWDWKKFAFIHHGAEPKRRIVDVKFERGQLGSHDKTL